MAKNKTAPTEVSVDAFIENVDNETKRDDAREIVQLMQDVSQMKPRMWGPSIIGFGSYHYEYDSGHSGDAPLIAFSPRKSAITLYLAQFPERDKLLEKLGKHKTGKGCLYINKMTDIDKGILKDMILSSVQYMKERYKWTP